jgi:Zn-dependent protease with chaperone function
MAAFGISGAKRKGLAALFATHPDLDDRISALERSRHSDYRP